MYAQRDKTIAPSSPVRLDGQATEILAHLSAAIYSCDANGVITWYNAAAVALWGREPELGKDKWCGSWHIYRPDGTPLPLDECPMAVALREGRDVDGAEVIIEQPKGVRRNILPQPRVLRGPGGEVTGAVNLLVDITDIKQLDAALREGQEHYRTLAEATWESERKIRRILDSSVQFMGLLDVDGKLLEANSTSLAFAGQRRETQIGRPYWETAWWAHSREIQASIREAVEMAAKGATVRMETTHVGIDGRTIDVDFSLKPIRDSAGRICNLLPEARDITDRKRVEAALKVAKESAEAANHAKDRFLAMLSHELRTPLAPVLATVAGMESDPYVPERMRDDISLLRRNIELEAKLIDDLLDLSRIISGKLQLNPERIGLNEAMRQVCAMCRSQIIEKGLRFDVSLDQEAGQVYADPARLQQVMWNLLKNAIKFTPEGGSVWVRTEKPCEGLVSFEVRDTGIGMDPMALVHIFEAFEQGGDRTMGQFGGLGLGLAISKSLIERSNGLITAQSDGPGKGSTFRVVLPAVIVRDNAEVTRVDRFDAKWPAPARLLLVEDHEDTATALTKFLDGSGFAVKHARRAGQAFDMLCKERFDLVMSDIGLPDATGYDLMKRIRERWNIVGIAMSGYGMEDDIRKSHEAGFSEHLVKPVKMKQLEETIHRLLR